MSQKKRTFNDTQLCILYSWIRAHEQQPIWREQCRLIRFALGTGLRESEIIEQRKNLTIKDNGEFGITVEVFAEWSKNHNLRTTPCIPELVPYLRSWLSGMDDGEYLFHKKNGKPYTTKTLQRWWGEVCDAANLPDLGGMHGTRHTWASQELLSGRLTLPQVSLLAGHAKYDTTVRYYIHVEAESVYSGPIVPKWRAIALGLGRPQLKIAG